jgi:Ser/Thr protein kinase RdoA (MazF antagonist)
LLELKWLRGASWIEGEDRESFEVLTAQGLEFYTKLMEDKDSHGVHWDQLILDALTNCATQKSWERFRERLNEDSVWTLVHGDFHPTNQLYDIETNEITVLDFDMVGLGSGP